MLGLCSFCGPAFLFGVLPRILPTDQVMSIFVLQLETGILLAACWPGHSGKTMNPPRETFFLTEAVQKAMHSMFSICAWVILAGIATGLLQHWFFPLLPDEISLILTGLLELTNGIFSLPPEEPALIFLLCSVFVCFGGISVLLQIGAMAGAAELRMGQCIAQKILHGLLGAIAAAAYLQWGTLSFFLPPIILFLKITLEIPGQMVYNDPRKEGI